MNGAGGSENDPRLLDTNDTASGDTQKARVEIYGPKGLREYIRSSLGLTYTHLSDWYIVHELHFPNDLPSDPSAGVNEKELTVGLNIPQDSSGFWRNIATWTHPTHGHIEFTISAGKIHHSVPSIGYVLSESPLPGKIPPDYAKCITQYRSELVKTSGYKNPMEFLRFIQSPDCPADAALELPDGTKLMRPPLRAGRKITVLGDTNDPSPIIPLAIYSDVLVHESTNAYLPGVDPLTKETEDYGFVEERTKSRGHSTPEMAGRFARAVKLGIKSAPEGTGTAGEEIKDGLLILNHFSSRYKDDEADGPDGLAARIMGKINACAKGAWMENSEGGDEGGKEGGGRIGHVICARDGVPIEVKA